MVLLRSSVTVQYKPDGVTPPGSGLTTIASGVPFVQIGGTVPAPTLLPLVSTQEPDTAAYDALGVPSMPAGEAFADPVTGVVTIKLTDSAFPAANSNAVHQYAEGAFYVGQEWVKNNRRTVTVVLGVGFGLSQTTIDVDIDALAGSTGNVSNPHVPPGISNGSGCMSPVPGEERILYYHQGGVNLLRRYDLATQSLAEGGTNFPHAMAFPGEWLQTDYSARYWVWKVGTDIYHWDSVLDVEKNRNFPGLDEPHIDRESGVFVVAVVNGSVWRVLPDTIYTPVLPANASFAHAAAPRGYVSTTNVAGGGVTPTGFYDMVNEVHTPVANFGAYQPDHHTSGCWMQSKFLEQWVTGSWFCNTCAWSGNDGPDRANVFFRKNVAFGSVGEARLLGHSYSLQPGNATQTYWSQPHGIVGIDGSGMMDGSNMNSLTGRLDTFFQVTPRG